MDSPTGTIDSFNDTDLILEFTVDDIKEEAKENLDILLVKNFVCATCHEYKSVKGNKLENHLKIFCEDCYVKLKFKYYSDWKDTKCQTFKSCSICFNAFFYNLSIDKHCCRLESSCVCSVCDLTLDNKDDLMKHLKQHELMLSDKKLHEFSQRTTLLSKNIVHSGVKPHSYSQKSKLKSRKLIHKGVQSYSCSFCKKMFTRKDGLKRHELLHSGVKPYSCSVCEKSFSQKGNLLKHERIHSKVKSYSCLFCEKFFSRKDYLKTHELIHSGVKPYSCSACEKSFLQKSDLKKHELIHSGVKPYSCSVCEKLFSQKGSLRRHEREGGCLVKNHFCKEVF